jgi:hypothetical protein
MMTDLQILQELLQQIKSDSTIEASGKEFYANLVARFEEDGYEIEAPDALMREEEENALRNLAAQGYLKICYGNHPYGWGYRIDLRGHHFHVHKHPDWKHNDNVTIAETEKQEVFNTGAMRDCDEGKIRPDLVSPFAMERLGELLRLGAAQYSERNYERGMPVSRCLASLYRHLIKFQQGCADEDHLAAVIFNAVAIIHVQEMVKRGVLPDSLLDMPNYTIPTIHQNKDEPLET